MIRIVRFVAAFAVTSALVTLLAAAGAQGWRPAADRPALHPETDESVVTAPPLEVSQRSVVVPSTVDGADPVDAWIVQPSGSAPRPGAVLIRGAGSGDRDDLLSEARSLAAGGVAAIVYDKRTVGFHPVRRDFGALADDALAAAEVLRSSAGVDPSRVGLIGWSEGGWVVAEAARRAPGRIAFAGLMSAPIVAPAEQIGWSMRRAVPTMPPWIEKTAATGLGAGRHLLPWTAYDSRSGLGSLRVPIIAFWGADDPIVPVNEAVGRLRASVGGHLSVHVLGATGHHLPVSSGYLDCTASWIGGDRPETREIRGVEPATALGVGTLPTPSWESHPLVLVTASTVLAALTVILTTRRRRARGAS